MDVELLSAMIKELVIDHDEVGLPFVGTFVAELVPASFSDKGFTINPPYRRLSFYSDVKEERLLADFYSKSNNIPFEAANQIIGGFLKELLEVLKSSKTVVLPSLGRLRATRENNFFFVPDPDLDIFPEGFALEPISLRSHSSEQEATHINFSFSPSELSALEIHEEFESQMPETEAQPEPKPMQMPEPEVQPEPKPMPETEVQPEPLTEPDAQAEPIPDSEAQNSAGETSEAETQIPAAENPEPETQTEPVQESGPGKEKKPRRRFRWWIILLILLFLAVMALLTFITLSEVAPDFIDSLLYSPEELRILNY